MTRGDVPGKRIMNRPFKPMAVGLLIVGTTLAVNVGLWFTGNDAGIPLPGDSSNTGFGSFDTAATGLFAAIGLLLMFVAWILRNQRMYEFGLLFSFGAWTARWIGITLDGQLWYATLPLGVSVMAAGAYWLERIDDRNGMK